MGDTSQANCYLYYSSRFDFGLERTPGESGQFRQDTTKARGGGRSFVYNNNRIIRTAQKDETIYGEQVQALEVDLLTDQQYGEHEIPESPLIKDPRD